MAALAEFWWVGPAAVGAGTVGWLGVRHQRAENARRLEYDAARHDLRGARAAVTQARVDVKVARAEVAKIHAERAAGRRTNAEVAAARRDLQTAERELRAATAGVRSRKAQVAAARAALPSGTTDPASLPVGRLMAAHDAVTARWLEYETDPAKLIAFPAMSDAREPLTGAYLTASAAALQLRPDSAQARITTADYAAYRDAVHRLEKAFAAAEERAWQLARGSGSIPPGTAEPPGIASAATPHWADVAQSVITKSAEAITRAAESARAVAEGARQAATDARRARPGAGSPDTGSTGTGTTDTDNPSTGGPRTGSADTGRPSAGSPGTGTLATDDNTGTGPESSSPASGSPPAAPKPATAPKPPSAASGSPAPRTWPVPSRTRDPRGPTGGGG